MTFILILQSQIFASCLIRCIVKNGLNVRRFWFMSSFIAVLLANLVNCKARSTEASYYYEFKNTANRLSYYHEELNHLPGEQLDLQFLTNVRGSSLHQSNRFHVVNATFPKKWAASYIIHMSLDDDLVHPKLIIPNSGGEDVQCLFSGTIADFSNKDPKSGIVSLSSCTHKIGFEGLILLPNERYYIHPTATFLPSSSHSPIRRSADTYKPPIPHKAYKLSGQSQLQPHTGRHFDDLKMPPPKRLKEALKSSLNLKGHKSSNLMQNDGKGGIELVEEGNVGDSCLGGICKSLPPVMVPLSNGNDKKANGNSSKSKSKTKTPKATTSSSSGTKVVDIAVFTDERLYTNFKWKFPNDTKTKINHYVLAIINNMNALYKQPSMPEKISFRLVHLEIQTEKPHNLKDHNSQAGKYLASFCQYSSEKNQYGSLWDHAILFTGLNLQQGFTKGTVGIAWFGTMCVNGYSCSVIESFTLGSAFTTAHELGHSLGMPHDGTGPSKGCSGKSTIMSAYTGGGGTDWSECSMKSMEYFINNGYGGNPPPKCLTEKGGRADNAAEFVDTNLPGQRFDANIQCDVSCLGCTPYTLPPYNDMCHLLHCKAPSSKGSRIRGTHPALEGTTCATGKKCHLGKCV